MLFAQVQQILNDLPLTFKRPGAPYTQIIDAMTAGESLYTQGADGILQQLVFLMAQGGWLDLWGLLFNVPRLPNEADSHYQIRIVFSVTSGNGTALGIQLWIRVVWNVVVTVTENLPNVGYTITFPATMTVAQITQIVANLSQVRPAGVPITGVFQPGTGSYLRTINFFNAPRVTGAFLGSGLSNGLNLVIPVSTNNAQPLIPDLLLTDPTLNPQ